MSFGLGSLRVASRAGNVGMGVGSTGGNRGRISFSLGRAPSPMNLDRVSFSRVRVGWLKFS